MGNLYYTGIGSRKCPIDILDKMSQIADVMQQRFTLRSGGADGADKSFESGVTNGNKEIYLPWKGFNHNGSPLYEQSDEAFYIASQYHPNWKNLKESVRKLMARNVLQVLGEDLKTPSLFVICWTPDGCQNHLTRSRNTGGTGQAISIASEKGIEIINMKNLLWENQLLELLQYRIDYEKI